MRLFVLSLLVVSSIRVLQAQESAQYLQNAIRDLRYMKGRPTYKRVDTQPVQSIVPTEPTVTPTPKVSDRRTESRKNVPPLSLTKGELAALYEAAVSKGETVKLNTGDNSYIQAAVHELDENKGSENDETSGYYYYYYPVKSFMDDMATEATNPQHFFSKPTDSKPAASEKPQYQYHSHTHQHNVKITSTKEVAEKKEKKALEPLFMAISGFIGMAVMFVLSVLVFPKFGIKKPKVNLKNNIKKSERITDIARVALQAIEGKDCAERFACELEKTARAFNLQDNRLLKRMAPGGFGKQMEKVGRNGNKRLRCTAIPCKKKSPPKKKGGNDKKKS